MASKSEGVGRGERGVTRRGVLTGGLAGIGGVAAGGIAPGVAGAADLHRVGEPGDGTAAAEVVGHLDQVGDAITGYGYLTRIHGLREADLFRGPGATEATARFTFFSKVQVNARFVRGALVSVDGVGTLAFFLDPDGADFANPATFSDGTAIAKFEAHFHNLLTVLAPNQGVSTIAGELTQHQARTFSFEGRRTQFGNRGLRLHLSVAGPSQRTAPSPPTAFFEVAGDITVVT
jgi:hypothetical protein